MSSLEIGYLSFPLLLLIIFLRAPIGLAMLLCGIAGLYLATDGTNTFMSKLKTDTYDTFSSYSLTIIPMFLLMGQFATLSGMSQSLFKAAESWLGHRKGGGRHGNSRSLRRLRRNLWLIPRNSRNHEPRRPARTQTLRIFWRFSTATLAAGGTLGILIPPSVILVIYAILTEQNIAKLFLAAFIPGLLAAIGYMITISIYVRFNPKAAGTKDAVPYSERWRALVKVWPVLLVFGLVVGGIYLGWFTPTEGAAVGAAGTGLLAWASGNMTRKVFTNSIIATATSTAMIFFIILGAALYNSFLALSQVPQEMSQWVVELGWSPWAVLGLILLFYLIFGCIMDSLFYDLTHHSDFLSCHQCHGFRYDTRTSRNLVRYSGFNCR